MFKQVPAAMAAPLSSEVIEAEDTEAGVGRPDAALRLGDALARQGCLGEALDAYAAARRIGLTLSGERLCALARLIAARLRLNISSSNSNNINNNNIQPSRRTEFAPSGKRGEEGSAGTASLGSGSGSASPVRPGGLGSAALSGLGSEMSAVCGSPGSGSSSGSAQPCSGLFDCCLCRFWLSEPVTLSCGHSCCRSCAEVRVPAAGFDEAASSPAAARHHSAGRCGTCGAVWAAAPVRVNVLLGGLLAKWFPRRAEAARLRVEAARLLGVGAELRATLGMCERALALVPGDVGALVMGSRVRLEMGDPAGALHDTEKACRAQPHNAQAVVARGWSLLALGRQEDAVVVLLRGLALDAAQESVAHTIGEILSEWLSPVPEQVGVASRGLKSGAFLQSLSNQPAIHLQCTEGQAEAHKKRKYSASDSDYDGEGQPPHRDSSECDYISELPRHRIDSSDLECALCMRLLWEPVTTPCGHTFCTACLERSLDHRHQCPLCKEGLVEFLARAVFARNACLEGVMVHFLAEERRERERQNAEERKEMAGEVPIFVCTVAFPWVPCPLHVFEARYRLMLRRCVRDGSRSFGMCAWDQQHGFADVGCMLEVRGVHLYPDGRSLVSAVGGRRFQVVERSARDGYSTARVTQLHDTPVRGDAVRELCRLHEVVRARAERWFSKLEPRYHGRISQHFGDMPETEPDIQAGPDGPAWLWWLIAVLPLEPRVQLGLLGLTSLPERLVAVAQLLTYTARTHAPQPPQPPSLQRPQQQPSHQQQLQQQPIQQLQQQQPRYPQQLQQQLQQQPNQQQLEQQQQQFSHQQQLQQQPQQQLQLQPRAHILQHLPDQQQTQHQPLEQPLRMLEPMSQQHQQEQRNWPQRQRRQQQEPCQSQQQPPCDQQQQQIQQPSQPQAQQHRRKQEQPHVELHPHQQHVRADVTGTPGIAMEEQPTTSPWMAVTQQPHVQSWGRPGHQPRAVQPNVPATSDSHPQQQEKSRVRTPLQPMMQLSKRLHARQQRPDAAVCAKAHATTRTSQRAARSNTRASSRTATRLTVQVTAHSTPHVTSQSTVHAINDADPRAIAAACAVTHTASNAAAHATAYATAHTTAHAITYAAAYTTVQTTVEATAHTERECAIVHSDPNAVGHTVTSIEGQAMACPETHGVGQKSRHVARVTDVPAQCHTTKHTMTRRPTLTAENPDAHTAENTHTVRHKSTRRTTRVDMHTIGHATSHPSPHPTVHTDSNTTGHITVPHIQMDFRPRTQQLINVDTQQPIVQQLSLVMSQPPPTHLDQTEAVVVALADMTKVVIAEPRGPLGLQEHTGL